MDKDVHGEARPTLTTRVSTGENSGRLGVDRKVILGGKKSNSAVVGSEVKVTPLSPTLGNPIDCTPPGPSVHGILQARILEWVAIAFSRESSQPRD